VESSEKNILKKVFTFTGNETARTCWNCALSILVLFPFQLHITIPSVPKKPSPSSYMPSSSSSLMWGEPLGVVGADAEGIIGAAIGGEALAGFTAVDTAASSRCYPRKKRKN
jgi:hypothetical protein